VPDASATPVAAEELLSFWFGPEARERWFDSTPEFDAELTKRYLATWEAARDGRLADWEETPRGALALVIVLDQLPLNLFRGRPESFSTEAQSRSVAERALARGFDTGYDRSMRSFLCLPFMHSESLADQDRSVALYAVAGDDYGLKWAMHHRDIVLRFDRFPHRNSILGRASSDEELAWLNSDEAFSA